MKIILYTFSLFILLNSCNKVTTQNEISNNTQQISKFDNVKGIEFKEYKDYKYGKIDKMMQSESSLKILNFNPNNGIMVYDYNPMNDNIKGLLNEGRGPGEVLGVDGFGVYNNIFWLYDITKEKLLLFDNANTIDDKDLELIKTISIHPNYSSITLIDTSQYLVTGNYNSKSKASIVNIHTGKVIREIGHFSNPNKIDNIESFKDIFTSYIHFNPSKKKFALIYRYTDVIEIFDINTSEAITKQGPECFAVDWELGERNGHQYMKKTHNTRKAFVQAYVTEKYIYALYSGERKESKNWSYGNRIFVYNWEGDPLYELELDQHIYSFAVDQMNTTIYAQSLKTGSIIKASLDL